MHRLRKQNLYHIKRHFENNTGIQLLSKNRNENIVADEIAGKRKHIPKLALIASIIIVFLSLTAFAVSVFSTFAGDNLTITASYYGSGIVWVDITNQSDKDLKLEPKINLYLYSTQELIHPTDEAPYISELTVPANTTEKIRLDLRRTYDIEALESTKNDFYYLQLTNDSFLIGQKWSCMVSFKVSDYVTPWYQLTNDKHLDGVLPSLKAYYQNFTPDIFARWPDAFNYMELLQAELSKVDGKIVRACDPPIYFDCYDWLGSTHWSTFSAYNKLLGLDDSEYYDMIGVDMASVRDDGTSSGGGWIMPLFYLYQYRKADITSPKDYAFMSGNLLTFEALEPYKVYDDGEYVIYEMHHLFYTDLKTYVNDMLLQRDDVYLNDQIWDRIESFYNHFCIKENMESAFYNAHDPGIHAKDKEPTMEDVIALSKKGEAVSFEDIRQYKGSPSGLSIYESETGGKYCIDGNYELFYGQHLDGSLRGWYLIHKPTGESIDIRYDDVEEFVAKHGNPLPRCCCENTEEGWHGWMPTLDWLVEQNHNILIYDLNQACKYDLETDDPDAHISVFPLYDTEEFYLEDSWSEENHKWTLWLVHKQSGDKCDVETEDMALFVENHI